MRELRFTWLLIVLLPAMAACSGSKAGSDSATPGATPATAASTGTSASANKSCALYSNSEISGILGATVGDGEAAGPMATTCQWNAKGADRVFAQVQILPGTDN